MKYALPIFSLIIAIPLTAVQFKISNALKEPVTLSFDIYSDTGAFIPYHIRTQSFSIPFGTSVITPKLAEAGQSFGISAIYVKSKKYPGSDTYSMEEDKKNKNLLIKLVLGKAQGRLTATGPTEAMGPVFDVVQVMQ